MADLGEVVGPSVVIRKYANRRLYDTSRSRYVTLEEVARMVGDGANVRVVRAREGTDITRQVFAQIILEGESGEGLLDEDVLRGLIRLRRHPEKGVLSRHISGILESFAARGGTRTESRPGIDAKRAGARIDALRARIERLIAAADRRRD